MIERRQFRPGVTHALCTQMNGECVGYHCPECGQPCGDQGSGPDAGTVMVEGEARPMTGELAREIADEAMRFAGSPSPPESAPDADAIIERLREKKVSSRAISAALHADGRRAGYQWVSAVEAEFAVREAAAPSPPEPKCRAPHCWAEYGTPCADCPAAPSPPDTDAKAVQALADMLTATPSPSLHGREPQDGSTGSPPGTPEADLSNPDVTGADL